MEALPAEVLKHKGLAFATPSELAEALQPVAAVHVPYPISWADEERDVTAWLGNEMQQEAFDKLYALLPKISQCKDERDRKSTRLNSSHVRISYAVFCLKKKKNIHQC